MAQAKDETPLEIEGRQLVITHPDKLLIASSGPGGAAGVTKLALVNYYLAVAVAVAVAEGALRGAGGRPCMLVRYPNGIDDEFFFQKRAPVKRPDWLEVAEIRFPSGRSAEEVVPRHPADLAWMANLACLELHPHPVRADDLDHPDELPVDLDPVPGVGV
jgi:DNA primase